MNSLLSLIFIIIDILIYNFTPYHTYLFLLSLTLYRKKEWFPILCLGLLIDNVITNSYIINTVLLLFLFYINKKIFKTKNKKIWTFLSLNTINLFVYCLLIYLLKNRININNFSYMLLNDYLINLIIWIFSYNLLKKSIRINR